MRDTAVKRKRILEAAAALLAERGFDGMTLAAVSGVSGAAIGSIVNFYRNKAGLAAAVSDDLMGRLVADAEKALEAAHGEDIAAAIRALLTACLGWSETVPHYRRLIGMLEAYTPKAAHTRIGVLEDRLGEILTKWAEPLIRAHVLAALSPSQLYAVILAPALNAAAPAGGLEVKRQGSPFDWLGILTAGALAAITPNNDKPRQNSKPPPTARAGQGTKQGDLLR